MKRSILWLFICVLILGLCGCNSIEQDEGVNQVLTPPKEPPADTVTIQVGGNQYPMQKLTEEQLSFIKIESSKNSGSITFNPEVLTNLRWAENSYAYVVAYPTEPAPFSEYFKSLGSDGLIVAGYATGLRESRRTRPLYKQENTNGFMPEYEYTATQLHITDVYYGTPHSDTVFVKEGYSLEVDKENRAIYYVRGDSHDWVLKNGEQMLFLLRWDPKAKLYTKVHQNIPLMPDYRNYTEAYLSSVLDFYRGKLSEYSYLSKADDAILKAADPHRIQKTAPSIFWPERKISDEDLMKEMNDHIIITLATRYRIAIWPYGHRNYVYSCTRGNFWLASLPPSE
ncbi:MAG: hypothetical protein IJC46_00305 [Clostridia bacterium]|nr:hypothetical protein [Clostridia bacterium]